MRQENVENYKKEKKCFLQFSCIKNINCFKITTNSKKILISVDIIIIKQTKL